MIPGNANPLLLASAAADAAAAGPTRSLRFNSADSAYLARTPSSAGNRRTWTFSTWAKLSKLSSRYAFLQTSNSGFSLLGSIEYQSTGKLSVQWIGGSILYTDSVLRDPSAWYHIVVSVDTTQATQSNRVRLYLNGVEQTFGSGTYPAQNADTGFNATQAHNIGAWLPSAGVNYSDFNLADIFLIDGSALDPTSFAAFDDNGVWQAAAYSGTFGTNGFHLLDFANEATVGHDSSGNSNDFTANNISGSENPVYSRTAASSITNAANIFDGSTSTGGYSSSTGTNITLTTSSFTISTQLRVYNNFRSDGTYAICLNGTCVAVAGSGTDSTQYRYSTVDLSSFTLPLTVTSLGYSASQTSGNTLRAIEVDSTVLVDGTPSDLDVLFDVPTNGTQSDTGAGGEVSGCYATLNPLDNGGATLANGNLNVTEGSSASMNVRATIGLTSGKYYWELTNNSPDYYATGSGNTNSRAGISSQDGPINAVLGSSAEHYVFEYAGVSGSGSGGRLQNNNSSSDFGSVIAQNDVLNIACDFTAGKIWYGKNGTFFNSGDPANGTNASQTFTPGGKAWFPAVAQRGTGGTNAELNFGQRTFAYSAPSGFKALCTTNLPTPTIADGSDYFDVKTWTGNGGTQSISNLEFSPDLVWIKARGHLDPHALFDTVRGVQKRLSSNLTNAEVTSSDGITSFNADGWTMGANGSNNANNLPYVGWIWDAGSSTVSNTDGSITSSVRASQTAGFSAVTYTGTGAAASVGHGCGVAPSLIVVKSRSAAGEWVVYHQSLGRGAFLQLQDTAASVSIGNYWGTSNPSSTVFSLNNYGGNNSSGRTFLALCFAPVAGYSAFGSYEGLGGTGNPFVHTGFAVRFLMVKRTDLTGSWGINDAARNTFNPASNALFADKNNAEDATRHVDLLSNGFKLRNSSPIYNSLGGDYVYMAFASNPFQANGGLAR